MDNEKEFDLLDEKYEDFDDDYDSYEDFDDDPDVDDESDDSDVDDINFDEDDDYDSYNEDNSNKDSDVGSFKEVESSSGVAKTSEEDDFVDLGSDISESVSQVESVEQSSPSSGVVNETPAPQPQTPNKVPQKWKGDISTYDEFSEKYKEIRPTLYQSFITQFKIKEAKLDFINKKLESLIKVSIEGVVDSSEAYEYYDIHEFIILVLYAALNSTLGFDSDRLKAIEFGYKDCFDCLEGLFSLELTSADVGEAYSNISSLPCDISYNDYISCNLYCRDLSNVFDLMNTASAQLGASSDDLKKSIATQFNSNMKSVLNTICSRYDYILEGTFGIDRYVGVYTGSSKPAISGVVSGVAQPIEPSGIFTKDYYPVLSEILNLQVYNGKKSGRQFELSDILSAYNNSSIPLYFPYKVLEIISKCGRRIDEKSYTFTRKTQLYNYQRLPEAVVGNQSKYLGVVREYFKGLLSEYIYYALIWYCQTHFSTTYPVLKKVGKDSDENKSIKNEVESVIYDILECSLENISDTMGYSTLKAYIIGAMKYFADCVTTVVVLDKCVVGKNDDGVDELLDFRFKVCSRLNKSAYSNKTFIESVAKKSGLNISDFSGVVNTSAKVDEGGFFAIDLQYTFNADKVNARPTFAYKALQVLKEQQTDSSKMPVSWQNILLGRNLSDRILTSGASGEINMQKNQVHWVFSGSRSGKGVMCYNIFSTAIGGRIPIFYIDRKPDTATVLSELCPEMFCVNGGQYDAKIDTRCIFKPDTYKFEIPSYLKTYFSSTQLQFDFVYFRSIMLVLAMFDYADTFKESPLGKDLQSAFGGGVLLVLDEFSNFINEFLDRTKPMSCSSGSWLAKAYSQVGMEKKLKEVSDEVVKAETALAKAQSKKDVSEKELSVAQENLDAANSKEFELDRVYWAAVADAYKYIQDSLAGKKDAAGAVAKSMQIFVIGQNLDKVETVIGNADWFNTGAAGNMLKFNKSDDIIPLIHLLGGLSSDIITGFQIDRQSYLAQGDKKFKTKNMLNQSRRCFAYKKFESFTQAEINKVSHTATAFKDNESSIKNYLDTWTYFKPFLILNNAVEPPECVRSKDFAPTSEKRLNIRKGNEKLDSMSEAEQQLCMQSQFVGQCLSSCEDAGLTWEDLLSDNDDGSGHLNQGVGFEGYITQLADGVPIDSMALSGQLANRFIHEVYGYPKEKSWRDFVCDFRPEWIISTKGYTADGTSSIVQDKLSDSFFSKPLLSLNVAKKLGNKLESLLPYYEDTSGSKSAKDDLVDANIYGVVEETVSPEASSSENYKTNIQTPSSVQQNESLAFSEEERMEAAQLLVEVIKCNLPRYVQENFEFFKHEFLSLICKTLIVKGY